MSLLDSSWIQTDMSLTHTFTSQTLLSLVTALLSTKTCVVRPNRYDTIASTDCQQCSLKALMTFQPDSSDVCTQYCHLGRLELQISCSAADGSWDLTCPSLYTGRLVVPSFLLQGITLVVLTPSECNGLPPPAPENATWVCSEYPPITSSSCFLQCPEGQGPSRAAMMCTDVGLTFPQDPVTCSGGSSNKELPIFMAILIIPGFPLPKPFLLTDLRY